MHFLKVISPFFKNTSGNWFFKLAVPSADHLGVFLQNPKKKNKSDIRAMSNYQN